MSTPLSRTALLVKKSVVVSVSTFFQFNSTRYLFVSFEVFLTRQNCMYVPLLFGRYKFHLAKSNRDINQDQDDKIGLLATDSARIAFFQQKTGAKTSKYTTLLPKSQIQRNLNAHCLDNTLLQDVPQQNQNNECRVCELSKSG